MIELVRSPSQIENAGLLPVDEDVIGRASCEVLSDIENDLRTGATTFPVALRPGDYYMIAIVDAHEQLHIAHLTTIYTNAYRDLLAQFTAISAASQPELDAAVERILATFRAGLDQAIAQEDAHVPASFTIHVTPQCRGEWSARSNTNWIEFRALFFPSNSGSADALFLVACNPQRQPRIGTVTVAGQIVTVEQQAFGTVGVECARP